ADADYIYAETQGGAIIRVNRHTHQMRDIQPRAGYNEKLRWNWNTPLELSPHEKGTLYMGAQFLFRTRDHGQSWDRISPDLTTNDPLKQKQEESGGVTVDNSAAETNTTIYSISESPKQAGLIWVGTDDGNLQLTRDDGKSWTNVVGNIKDLPKGEWVSWVQAGNFDAGTAFASFDRHTYGDMAPYIYKTTDYGKSWTALVTPKDTKGLHGYVHVIKQDIVNPQLLFAGTEFGLWVSIDGGGHWAQFKGGDFPAVAVRDLAIQPRDDALVLATHGRGIWIVDDITPLRNLSAQVLNEEAGFLPVQAAQQRISAYGGWSEGDASFTGPNPKDGARIAYYQKSRHLFGKLKIDVLDAKGEVIDSIPANVRRGINLVYWPMRVKPPRVPPAAQVAFNSTQGARVPPGTYTVRMTKGDATFDTKVQVNLDRRANYTVADRQAQYAAAQRVSALFGRMTDLVYQLSAVRMQADADSAKLGEKDALRQQLAQLGDKADEIRKKIVATKQGGAITGEERLREHADTLYGAIMSYDGKPADYQLARIDTLTRELDDVAKQFADLQKNELAKTNAALQSAKHAPIMVPAGAPADKSGGSAEAAKAYFSRFERD
ncbi:MAG: sialidase, partial [Proteobacteria bacterium]|nr:sialidase [Pseudomonadota bacterium]